MNNNEFMAMYYGKELMHKWVTSNDPSKREFQKKQEQAYNKKYYQEHRDEILKNLRNKSNKIKDSVFRDGSSATSPIKINVPKSESESKNKSFVGPIRPDEMRFKVANAKAAYFNQKYGKEAGFDNNYQMKMQSQRERISKRDHAIDERNIRAKNTGLAQGRQQKANFDAKPAELERKKWEASAVRGQREQIKRRRAQARAAAEKANDIARQVKNNADIRNSKASNAQAESAKKRSAHAHSFEGKLERAFNRAVKKVSNLKKKAMSTRNKVYSKTKNIRDKALRTYKYYNN